MCRAGCRRRRDFLALDLPLGKKRKAENSGHVLSEMLWTVAVAASDDAFVQWVVDAGLFSTEQLEAARQAQRAASERGVAVSIADVLVQQGSLTPTLKENIEKKLQSRATTGSQISGYTLVRQLGEGGMGVVYLGEEASSRRQVAVKILPAKYATDPARLARFRREAQAASKLQHENIARAYAAGEENGQYFYVMEYVDGEPLDRMLGREKALSAKRALNIVVQVARGLDYAHRNGIIHRDIKPSNIFVTPDGRAKILDLGLSKDILDPSQSFKTETGVALGTAHYISPEQARGEKSIDGRADIYSLGAMFYHLVTGRTPFQGSTPAVIMMKHLSEQLPNPLDINPGIPESVVQVIERMMAKSPANRYPNALQLLSDLDRLLAGLMPSSREMAAEASTAFLPRTRSSTTDKDLAVAPTLLAPAAMKADGREKPARLIPSLPTAKRRFGRLAQGLAASILLAIGMGLGIQYGSRTTAPDSSRSESAKAQPPDAEPGDLLRQRKSTLETLTDEELRLSKRHTKLLAEAKASLDAGDPEEAKFTLELARGLGLTDKAATQREQAVEAQIKLLMGRKAKPAPGKR